MQCPSAKLALWHTVLKRTEPKTSKASQQRRSSTVGAADKNVTFATKRSDKAYPSSARWYLEFGRKKRRAGQVLLCRCLTTATRGASGECREREAGQRQREELSPRAVRVKREYDEMKGRGRKRENCNAVGEGRKDGGRGEGPNEA